MNPSEKAKVRILIADKSPIVRYGLEEWIGTRGNFEVVGLARNAQELKRLLISRAPELVVMDLALLEHDAVNKWKELQAEAVGVRLVSYGSDADFEVQRAVDCRAAAHVLKSEDLSKLDGVLTSVHMGNSYLQGTPREPVRCRGVLEGSPRRITMQQAQENRSVRYRQKRLFRL